MPVSNVVPMEQGVFLVQFSTANKTVSCGPSMMLVLALFSIEKSKSTIEM